MKSILSKAFKNFCTSANKPVSLKYDNPKNAAFIKLTNPKKRNTLSLQTISLLKQSLNQIQGKVSQKKIRIAILEGEGTVFSSGHDLKELSKLSNPKQVFDACAELMLKVHNMPIPIVCVVNGIAAAAGFQLAMACDILVATDKSTFSCPGVKWGLFCSTPAVELVRKINSVNKANEILYFGEEINAKEAYDYGLANKVVPQDKLQQTVQGYITKINNLSAQVVINGKKVLREQRKQNIQKAYDIAGMAMNKNIQEIQDCKEGLKAFAQKRHPHFKN